MLDPGAINVWQNASSRRRSCRPLSIVQPGESQDQDRRVCGYGIGRGAARQQNLSVPFHQVLVGRCHFRIFIRLCRRLRHKETDADYQHQGCDTDHSFSRGRPHRELSFRRRCSLSFIISVKSATGRISIGPSPYLKPGSCDTS